MREIQFKYIWKRPNSGAGPYRPTDAKFVVSYITLSELEKGKQPKSPIPHTYYLIVARCQYIEKEDENGRKIYDGDILLADKDYADYEIRLQVKWNNERAGFCLYDIIAEDMAEDDELYALNNCYTVIGNIYENPELLKGVK